MEVVASLSQGRTAAAQCGWFTHKSVPVIFEPPCTSLPVRLPIQAKFLPIVTKPASTLCFYHFASNKTSIMDVTVC